MRLDQHNLWQFFFFSNVLSLSIIQAAYRDNTLGLPKVCPQENVTTIDQSIIYTFLNSHYDPSRMVLAGVGVEHDALVECAQKYCFFHLFKIFLINLNVFF